MSFTMFFAPTMLAVLGLAAVLLVQGVRQRKRKKWLLAMGLFGLAGTCMSLLMEFITRM